MQEPEVKKTLQRVQKLRREITRLRSAYHIENAPNIYIELSLHPHHRKGGRKFVTSDTFLLAKSDFDEIKDGEVVRLMDCLNFVKDGKKFRFHSRTHADFKKYDGKKIIHYLPYSELNVEVSILMPDAVLIKGIAEPLVENLPNGEIVQFERFGFCRMDDSSKLSFWYCHK